MHDPPKKLQRKCIVKNPTDTVGTGSGDVAGGWPDNDGIAKIGS